MTELVGVAAVALVAWFAAGTIWNVRLGSQVMRWMQDGLPALGTRTSVRWLGSTAVQMVLQETKPPFVNAAVVIFLEPRDLPWWPISRARGRRDTLIVRGSLHRAPEFELEVLAPGSWSAREALSRVPPQGAVRKNDSVIHHDSPGALRLAEALLARAEHARLTVRRLSVRRAEPRFQLHVALPERTRSAREFFDAVHDLAELSSKSHP
jgi:hypothetical protein